jgi:hypothetical protein
MEQVEILTDSIAPPLKCLKLRATVRGVGTSTLFTTTVALEQTSTSIAQTLFRNGA